MNPRDEPEPTRPRPLSADQAAAVEKLYRITASRLFSRSLFLSQGNRQQADDLVQQVFEAAIKRWSAGGNPIGSQEYKDQIRWLFGVLNHKAVDAFRACSREGPLPDLDLDRVQPPYDTAHHALCLIDLDRALELMKKMPRDRHLVVSLRVLSGLPTREVAEMIGMKQATVRWHLMRAREELSREIGPILPIEDEEPGEDGPATERTVTA